MGLRLDRNRNRRASHVSSERLSKRSFWYKSLEGRVFISSTHALGSACKAAELGHTGTIIASKTTLTRSNRNFLIETRRNKCKDLDLRQFIVPSIIRYRGYAESFSKEGARYS